MSHDFPCSPQGGKLSQLNPTCCIGKTILGGIYSLVPWTCSVFRCFLHDVQRSLHQTECLVYCKPQKAGWVPGNYTIMVIRSFHVQNVR